MADHPQLTPEEREAMLAEPLIAVLATEEASGRPHLTPLWYRWDGSLFTIATPTGSRKHRNLERRPRFSLCIDKRTWPYRSLIAECEVADRVARMGYPEDLASRYLQGELLVGVLERYRPIEWQVVTGRATRWYGHVNRGG
jgi:pyridoxine/pyridoxamine 5'-phosphate oxidase